MSTVALLSDHDKEILSPLPRHERTRLLLTGQCGPLLALPYGPDAAAIAYVIYLAWIRARVPGHMLSGRPGYEAAETLRTRVFAASRRAGTLDDFGHELFRRLRLSISQLATADAVWWRVARAQHGHRWLHLSDERTLTDACVAVRLLDDLLREVPATDAQEAT